MRFCALCLIFALLFVSLPVAAMDIIVPTTTPTLQPVRVIVIPVTTTTTNPIGAISIASIPSGATVIIDGSVLGSTPYTIRTLTAGSHSLLLQLGRYQDYSTTFTITQGTLNQQIYTLVPVTTTTTAAPGISVVAATITTTVPVTTVTTANPGITVVTATTTIPVTASPTSNVSAQYGFSRPVQIRLITITIGNHTKSPVLSTLSPYYSAQISGPGTTRSWYMTGGKPCNNTHILYRGRFPQCLPPGFPPDEQCRNSP